MFIVFFQAINREWPKAQCICFPRIPSLCSTWAAVYLIHGTLKDFLVCGRLRCGMRCALRPSTFSTEAAVPRCTYGTWRTPQLQFQQTPFFPDFEGEGPQWRIWYWCRYWYYWYWDWYWWNKMHIFSNFTMGSMLFWYSGWGSGWCWVGLRPICWTWSGLYATWAASVSCTAFRSGWWWPQIEAKLPPVQVRDDEKGEDEKSFSHFLLPFFAASICGSQMTMDKWPWMIASPFRCLRFWAILVRRLLKILQFQLCQSTSSALPRHLNGMEINWVFPKIWMGLKVLGI